MLPVERSAHVVPFPALMEIASVTPLIAATGVAALFVVPFPKLPLEFDPQQSTVPLASAAHESNSPAEIAVAVLIPLTVTGVGLAVLLPSPSSPLPPLPQQSTEASRM